MKLKKELLLIIVGAVLSVALIISMIVIIVSATDNSHKGQNHEIEWQVSVAPTYETEGLVTGKCAKCKKEFKEKLPKLGGSDYEIAEYLTDNTSCEVEKECVLKITVLDNEVKFDATLKGGLHILDGEEIDLENAGIFVIDENDTESKIKPLGNQPLTCDEKGGAGYFQCEKCKNMISVQVRKEHAPVTGGLEDVETDFPNCTDSGITEPFKCKYCSKTVQVTVPSRGHDYECDIKPNETSPETYTVTLKCKRCGVDDSRSNVVSYTEDRTEPTCGKKGKIDYVLALPGGGEFKFTVYLPALQHESAVYGVMDREEYSILAYPALIPSDLDESEIKCDSTKEFVGGFTCMHCGQNVNVRIYRPHKAPVNTKWTDDTSKGTKYRSYKCVDCDKQVREEIPASADHEYIYSVTKVSGGYEVTGTCIYCSDVKTVKAENVREIIAREATCAKLGQKIYRFTVDGKDCSAAEAIAKKAHTYKGAEIIESGKIYYCGQDGVKLFGNSGNLTQGFMTCDECHELIGVEARHVEPTDPNEIEIEEPTTETEGKKTYTCKACGKKIEETIPKKEEE